MIPVQLQIKNFLSYGPQMQTIDFAPYHLICLSGKNGHGKSALLDAMTWVLWGQARKTSGATKADDGLLRLGEKHMAVVLEFMCNATRYRVRREYTRSKRGETRLYIGMYDPSEDRFRSLTEKSTKETQQVIQSIVGLDYESFTNSVFIRQGQANAFSRKSPKERKDTLATILGIDRYEQYRKRTNEYIKHIDTKIEQLRTSHAQLHQEISHKGSLEEQYQQHTQSAQQLAQEEEKLRNQDADISHQDTSYAQYERELEHLRTRYNDLSTHYATYVQQLRSLVHAWRDTFRYQRRLNSSHLQATYEQQKERVSRFTRMHTAHQQAEHEARTAEQHAEQRKQTLYQQFLDEAYQAKQTCSQYKHHRDHINTQMQQLSQEYTSYAQAYEELRQEQMQQITQIPSHLSYQDIDSAYLRTVYQAGRLAGMERILTAQHMQTGTAHAHQIPRVRRAVTQAHTRQERLREQRDAAYASYRAYYEQIHDIRTREHTLNAYLAKLLQISRDYKDLQATYAHADKEYRHAYATYHEQYASEQARDTYIQRDRTYQYYRKQAESWRSQMQANYIDPETKHEAEQELQRLQEMLAQQQQAASYAHVQRERRTYITNTITTLKQIKREMTGITKQMHAYPDAHHKRRQLHQQRNEIAQRLSDIRARKEQAVQQQGALAQQIEAISNKEQQCKDIQQQIQQYTQQRSDYAHIAHAFSRDGIQALLIEQAIPEIEHEANILLEQLTDNQAHIHIESLRDLKSGKTKETLDIKISDSMGIRPYELFSGGEAFRIDFALRVAISQLLARRAGTQLQTLIIDEGFGSQDEDGLHHIMDAIYKIQDHFHKIIVVSHLPAMKGQFPAQFVVHKGPQGSNVQVHMQG